MTGHTGVGYSQICGNAFNFKLIAVFKRENPGRWVCRQFLKRVFFRLGLGQVLLYRSGSSRLGRTLQRSGRKQYIGENVLSTTDIWGELQRVVEYLEDLEKQQCVAKHSTQGAHVPEVNALRRGQLFETCRGRPAANETCRGGLFSSCSSGCRQLRGGGVVDRANRRAPALFCIALSGHGPGQ